MAVRLTRLVDTATWRNHLYSVQRGTRHTRRGRAAPHFFVLARGGCYGGNRHLMTALTTPEGRNALYACRLGIFFAAELYLYLAKPEADQADLRV